MSALSLLRVHLPPLLVPLLLSDSCPSLLHFAALVLPRNTVSFLLSRLPLRLMPVLVPPLPSALPLALPLDLRFPLLGCSHS